MNRVFSISVITALLLSLAGCAGSGNQPVLPQSQSTQPELTRTVDDSPNRHVLWGYWQCSLNTESGEIAAVPARTGLLHINAVGPLNNSAGLSISIDHNESDPPNGLLVLTVGLTHPFPGKDKFAGFDVRGILITTAGTYTDSLFLPGENDPEILNADGYTRWWNPLEFPVPGLLGYTPGKHGKDPPPSKPLISCINPYKQFADGLYTTLDLSFLTLIPHTDPNGRGVFRSGSTNSRLYRVQFPVGPTGPMVYFNYALDASWAAPSSDPPEIPDDFPLEANSDEAFILEAQVTGNTLWAVEGSPLGGGELDLVIECWDWQGWMDGYDGEIGTLKLVSVFCEFEEGVVPSVSSSGDGSATLTATVPGVPSAEGNIPVWIGVIAPGTNYRQTNQPAPNEPVAAYTLVDVFVSQAECESNDNEDCESAWTILPEDSKDGLLCLDVDETDWYQFTVPPTGSGNGLIHLFTYGVGDQDLYLYQDCPALLIDYSASPGIGDEELTLGDLGPGEYYIQVLMADDGDYSPRPYTLLTAITGIGEECTPDENNSAEDAETVALDDTAAGTVCLIGDPFDWYTFEITDGAVAFGTIDLVNGDYANNDIALYDETLGSPLYTGNNPGTADENLVIDSLDPGAYFLEVEAVDDSPTTDRPFVLYMDLQESTVDCDDQDGNNTYEEAVQISLVATEIGTVCFPTDPDWFSFEVSTGAVEGTITLGSGNMFDNDLALFDDPTEPPIEESAQVGNMDEVIDVRCFGQGAYYIRATASPDLPGANQDYTLSTNLITQQGSPTDFWVHCHIVRTTQGTNPATDPATIETHVAWASEFYGIWIDGSVNIAEISYIDNTAWLSLTTDEAEQMFEEYSDGSGALHIFYVNDLPDMPGAAAYAYMECQFMNHDNTTGLIVMSDYADVMVMAHEMGHAIGVLADMYLLDYYTCEQITYCETGPSDIFCLESDASFGNLMYWPVGTNINDYWISDTDLEMMTPDIDSQGENFTFFHTNYPCAFFEP